MREGRMSLLQISKKFEQDGMIFKSFSKSTIQIKPQAVELFVCFVLFFVISHFCKVFKRREKQVTLNRFFTKRKEQPVTTSLQPKRLSRQTTPPVGCYRRFEQKLKNRALPSNYSLRTRH